jgi:arylsulfatase A-like enzyme
MNRRIFLAGLTLLVLGTPAALAAGRPNILFLFADDQRADTIAAHGNRHIKTPNIDKLAAGGFNFRRNYCFGSNSGAVCVPSRAMLMSGKTWFDVKNDMSNAKLLPELLRTNGYHTFATGKWHNQEPSWLRCFETGKSIFFGGMSDHTQVPLKDLTAEGKLSPVRTGEKFSSEMFADAAVEFLSRYKSDKPFFAYVAFTSPHDPRQPPPEYREMYYKARPPLPNNFRPQHPFDNGHVVGRDENLAPWPRTREVISDQLCEYYGMVTHLDEQVGRVIEALEKAGKADNTILVYAADSGLAMGSHGLLGKQSIYEHSMHCPLIISGPGIPRGRETHSFTYLFDLYPTLCNLTGVKPPDGLAGEDLAPLWEGKKEKVRDSVFLPFQENQRAVRGERYKLIVYPKIGHMQLFDLKSDPDEMNNLIDDPNHAPQVESLLALMKTWQARVGDKLALPAKNKPAPAIDLTGKKRPPDQWQPKWIREKYFAGEE